MENKFENINNSGNPRIQRLEYNGLYIYFISLFDGCSCDYLGCENYYLVNNTLKVRDKEGNLIKNKNGKTKVKLSLEYIDEEEAIKIFEENYYHDNNK